MIWSDETHVFSCTVCPHLGAPCPEARALAAQLVDAVRCAGAATATAPAFGVDGFGRLYGCARTCPARFVAGEGVVAVYCDVAADADAGDLAAFADTFLGVEESRPVRLPVAPAHIPAAMVRAAPRTRLAPRHEAKLEEGPGRA